MALTHVAIANASRSFKSNAAELNNCVVVLPIAQTGTKAATVFNPTGFPIPSGGGFVASVASTGAGSLGLFGGGTYLYAITYGDSTTGTLGAPCSTYQTAVLTSNRFTLAFNDSNEATNTRVNCKDIWRTLVGGAVLFWVARTSHTATRFSDNNSDARISANETLKVGSQAHRQLPANTYAFVIRNQKRLFAFGDPNYPGDNSTAPTARWRGVARQAPTALTTSARSAVRAAQLATAGGTGAVLSRSGSRPGTTVYDGAGNQARWCEPDNPDAWPTDNLADIGGPEPIRSAISLGNTIIVAKDNQLFSWYYTRDPDKNTGDGSIVDMEVNRGACALKAMLNVDGAAYIFDKKGIYQYRGGQSLFEIGEPIKPIFDRINWKHIAQISSGYDEKRVYFSVPLDGEDECRYVLVLDRNAYESGRGVRWWLYYVPQGIRDMSTGYIGEDADSIAFGLARQRVCMIITKQGYEYFFAEGNYRDGVHPELTETGTIASAASQTLTVSGATFKTGNNDVLGAPVRIVHPRFPDTYIVASCTTTMVTFAASPGSTVPTGTSIVIGGMGSYWKSRLFATESPHDLKTAFGLNIEMLPTAKRGSMRFWSEGDRIAPQIVYESDAQTGWQAASLEAWVRVDTGGKFASHNRTGFTEIPLHIKDYGQMQIGCGQSGVVTPWFVQGFAVIETSKRTNR